MAPDPASAKAGQGLANPAKWVKCARNERSLWGECQGSGKDPYRTQVDLTGPAFHCSCPSRKFPCKHGLGLLLILAGKPAAVVTAAPPPWVEEWIVKRDATAEKKAAKVAEEPPDDPAVMAKRQADREKRAVKREDRVKEGLVELEKWLGDLLRRGLAEAQQHPAQFWDGMAARMIDCQAPGVARILRRMPGLVVSGNGWADRVLEQLGLIELLLEGYRRQDTLPPQLREDVRTAIGWTAEDLDSQPAVADRWQVVGQRVEQEEQLRVQRTWLIGENNRRPALCLSFAAGMQPLDVTLVPGQVLDADVAFYSSAAPLRAVVRARRGEAGVIGENAIAFSLAEVLEQAATAFAANPWLERFPAAVRECMPVCVDDAWHLRDQSGSLLPMARSFGDVWPIVATSGGQPFTLFGEWTGREFHPLSLVSEGKFIQLESRIV